MTKLILRIEQVNYKWDYELCELKEGISFHGTAKFYKSHRDVEIGEPDDIFGERDRLIITKDNESEVRDELTKTLHKMFKELQIMEVHIFYI